MVFQGKKAGFLFLFCIVFSLALFAGGDQERESAGNRDTETEIDTDSEIDSNLESEAIRLIANGLNHPSFAVRKAAVEGVRYIRRNRAPSYDDVLALLGSLDYSNTEPGWEFLKYTIIDTLYRLDSERTVQLLVESNDYVLSSFDLFRLFSIIGFENIPRFDNLFFYNGFIGGGAPFFPILCAELHESTGEVKYLNQIIFHLPGEMSPQEYLTVYRYLADKGLPVDRLEYLLLDKGGRSVFRSSPFNYDQIGRTYTLEELLFQAVLYRIGSAGEVFKTEFHSWYLELAGEDPVETVDPREYMFSSYIPLTAMTAELYAGIEPAESVDRFLTLFGSVQREAGLEIVSALRDAPYTRYRETLLSELLFHSDAAVRRLAVEGIAETAAEYIPDAVLKVLGSNDEPYIRGVAAEAVGRSGNRELAHLLAPLFTGNGGGNGPVLPVVAAGQYLRLFFEEGQR